MKYIDAGRLTAEIDKIIDGLKKKRNQNQLAKIMAAAEIETLELVKDSIDKMKQEDPIKPDLNDEHYNPYKATVESIAEMCKRYDKSSHSALIDFYNNVRAKCKDAIEYVNFL